MVRGAKTTKAFTLVELLVVIAIIAVLAALLFPVFASSKGAAKKTDCVSNVRQILMATQMYLSDSDGEFPQTRQSSSNPALDDAIGGIDEPIYQQAFKPIEPYVTRSDTASKKVTNALFVCPEDPDPFGQNCLAIDPDSPDVTSYLANAYFVFGLSEDQVSQPASTIYLSERRDQAGETPYCNDIYHPWFNTGNLKVPYPDMDPTSGAVATTRHLGQSTFGFVDGHAKALPWASTYNPQGLNLHNPNQQ